MIQGLWQRLFADAASARRPRARPLARRVLPACAILLAARPAGAIDVAATAPPHDMPDHALTIGERTLALPEGQWQLLSRELLQGGFSKRHTNIDAYSAWVAWATDRETKAIVHLVLPVRDSPRLHLHREGACHDDGDRLRVVRSDKQANEECVAVFAVPDMRATLQQVVPVAAQWMARQRLRSASSAVEIVYVLHSPSSSGLIEVYWPSTAFSSDDEAARWADGLQASLKPLFAGDVATASIPAPPEHDATSDDIAVTPPAPPSDSRATWLACLRSTEDRLDDGSASASDMAAVLYLQCHDQEMRVVQDAVDPALAQQLSRQELEARASVWHRQTVDSGLATSLVLERRAAMRRAASAL